jgi:predicted O-linked N-acetylglucosamine transferase (SPINDLY family)
VLAAHKRWGRLYRPRTPHDRFLFPNDPNPQRPPRIGFVSADLHRHAAAFLTLPAIEQLARLGFPLYCYKTDRKRADDDFSERFKAASVAWQDVTDLDDPSLIRQIMSDGIDILFDLSGHTAGNRLGIFAQRAAPIQLSWAGYVGTVGLDTYEGVIADPVEIPPEHDDSYVEPVIRLPDCYVSYHPPKDPPDVGPLPCLTDGRFTFGCFNRPAKLNGQVASVWARILAQVPNSRLLMMYGGLNEATTQATVHSTLTQSGVPIERVEMIGENEQSKLLRGYGEVDLALDPFPYSGGVTTLEAIWMGVPVVTLVGDTFAGRHSASHLTAAGLSQFCTITPDDYVALAIAWSQRREELAVLRGTLRERVAASPLCDAPRFAKNLAAELTRLWSTWCAKRTAQINYAGKR